MFATLDADCPAFTNGCPYSTPHGDGDAISRDAAAANCPAFADGCPYKHAESLGELAQLMTSVPSSHKVGGAMYGSVTSLRGIMAALHERSAALKTELGKGDCPVFSTSCPFKTLTTTGVPLVDELDYRTWSVFGTDVDTAELEAAPGLELSQHLKAGTKRSHRAAEEVHFVRNFIKGQIDADVYKHLVISLWHTYTALETELRNNAQNRVYKRLHFPKELERVVALEADLEFYFGEDWRTEDEVVAPPSACTQEYVDRIRQVGKDQPELLVAHAYTRYLGDLSGGQTLMRVAKKAMALPEDGEGTAFYRFEHIPSAKDFKQKYRALLDQTNVDAGLADLVVAEANLAFVMNMRVFEELDVLAGDAVAVRPLGDVLATLEMPVEENKKCPFAALGGPNPHANPTKAAATAELAPVTPAGQCPFPFILLHDPVTGLKDPKTWLALVVVLAAYIYEHGLGSVLAMLRLKIGLA